MSASPCVNIGPGLIDKILFVLHASFVIKTDKFTVAFAVSVRFVSFREKPKTDTSSDADEKWEECLHLYCEKQQNQRKN